jgi:hypothetical protein
VTRIPAATARGCCAARWARCRPGRGPGGCGCAPTGGYFAGELARAAHFAGVQFAIGAKRIAPLWRILGGVAEGDWVEATGMPGAQVTVAGYCPDWWPAATRLLIRRVRLAPAQVSADPRSRRPRTLHPDQRALSISELADADAVYGYSFIVTNLDVSTPEEAAAVEHWYRHRTATREHLSGLEARCRASPSSVGISADIP